MSSLLKVCLAVLLTASLGLWLPWPGEARLGTRLELRPMKIQTQGLQWLPESQSVSGVLDSLTQALTSAVQSVIDFVSSQLSDLMDSMIARTGDYVGGLVLANLTNIINNLGFVKSVRFLAEEVEYALNVTRQNLTGISFNFLVPNQVVQGSVKLNLKEVVEDEEGEEVPRSESDFAARPEIELAEFGVLGDYFNSFVSSLLNIITIWIYKGSEERCSEKFLCSVTADWARGGGGGGGILTPIFTSISSLSSLTDFDTLIAARSGFLGSDCPSLYPQCQLNL